MEQTRSNKDKLRKFNSDYGILMADIPLVRKEQMPKRELQQTTSLEDASDLLGDIIRRRNQKEKQMRFKF
jgi:hypothetical protein